MRKPIRQPSFATLTEAELDQIVAWLRCETYETVRQRVNAPRPEGFGLNISDKPLQSLFSIRSPMAPVRRAPTFATAKP